MSAESPKRGYRNPPPEYRFKPGQSGNPKGRPKGTRGLKTDLNAELNARFTIQMNGQPITASKQQLMMKALTARAAAGDMRAINTLTSLILQVFGADDRGGAQARLSDRDQRLLDEFLSGADASPSPDANESAPPAKNPHELEGPTDGD